MKIKLSYFDFDGGRGQSIRLALSIGNVPFEDDRIPSDKWVQMKSSFPFQALPVLFVDGVPLAQSNAICRFVGKLADMYPSDPWQAAMCDETLESVEELTMHIGSTMHLNDADKKVKREMLAAETIPVSLGGMEKRLVANGGKFFANQQLTVADLKVCDVVEWLTSGMLDHIPKDLVSRVAPSLTQHCDRIKNDSRIQEYYKKRAQVK